MTGKVVSRNLYAGEIKNNLREGYGIYRYSNKFFQYEGEWSNGKKHGHGKLIMVDGSFYEGQFNNGEITGHGFKRFASGQTYSGNFINGEPVGHGIMTYNNGMVYEGHFVNNQRSGYGILRAADASFYEGYFHKDLRHGNGAQTYLGGARYDGEWVANRRQGHGQMMNTDGSVYTGQWCNDTMNGQGMFVHPSGMVYEGLWVNDRPQSRAAKLVVALDGDKAEITQGDTVTIRVECRDDLGNIFKSDNGRELRLSAGFKYNASAVQAKLSRLSVKSSSESFSLFSMIEDMEMQLIDTPFGFTCVDYPILQNPVVDPRKLITENESNKYPQEDTDKSTASVPNHSDTISAPHSYKNDTEYSDIGHQPATPLTNEFLGSQSGLQSHDATDMKENISDTSLNQTSSVATKRTENGTCIWTNVKFAPPPRAYRPFMALDAIKESKKHKSSALSSTPSVYSDEAPTSHVDAPPRPGDYVIIVRDVTNPPFLGVTLEPGFVQVTILPKKKPPKKPKANEVPEVPPTGKVKKKSQSGMKD